MTFRIGMLELHHRTPRDEQARRELAAALDAASVGDADEIGVFEITLDAADQEAALQRVWDAVALAGVDDHIVFLEHPSLPEHWRPKSAAPVAGA
jgi:hypothetical protein